MSSLGKALLASFAVLLTGCDAPWWVFDEIPIEVTFRADGSCALSIDGKPVSTTQSDKSDTGSAGVISRSFSAYRTSCIGGQMLHGLTTRVDLYLAVPSGEVPTPGRYQIYPYRHDFDSIGGIVLVLDPSYLAGWKGGFTGASIEVIKGELSVNQVVGASRREGGVAGGVTIAGHLSAVARRRHRPLLE